jgi:hypothetical protein
VSAPRQRKRDALRNSLIALVVFAVVGGLVYQAYFTGEPGLEDAILVSSDEIESAEQAAGCETLVERDPLPEAGHFDRATRPRPTSSTPTSAPRTRARTRPRPCPRSPAARPPSSTR